jgi:tRNA-splicing endonuclease subunit Sen15, fungi type
MDLSPSPLTDFLDEPTLDPSERTHLHRLALQVQHNLRHQHFWTELEIHTHSPLTPHVPLPRPLVAGLPPQRLYVHPDEQIEQLQLERKRSTGQGDGGSSGGSSSNHDKAAPRAEDVFQPEREWVLPAQVKERWSLAKMATVFEGIGAVPPPATAKDEGEDDAAATASKWRKIKRVVLASIDEDSTVVYYIVHDGIVKPRQN